MKIVHIAFTFGYGGIETMLVNIANAQVELGHEVAIIIIEDVIEPKLVESLNDKVHIYFAHRKSKRDVMALLRINYYLIKENPNAVHLHSSSAYRLLLPMFKRISNCTLHDMPFEGNTRFIEQIPRRFAISQSVHDGLIKYKGVNSIINPNGIRPELIKMKSDRMFDSTLRIVQVSRLMHEKKGQDILIKACGHLKEIGYKNFHVDFIGEGESLSYLKGLCNEYGVTDMVSFLGTKPQQYIFNHLCDYDLFIQPSRIEGFGLTVAEAMAAKVPVLVSSGQGPAEVICNGLYGDVFENGNYISCALAIQKYITKSTETDSILCAYKRVIEVYNVKITAQNYIKNYIRR